MTAEHVDAVHEPVDVRAATVLIEPHRGLVMRMSFVPNKSPSNRIFSAGTPEIFHVFGRVEFNLLLIIREGHRFAIERRRGGVLWEVAETFDEFRVEGWFLSSRCAMPLAMARSLCGRNCRKCWQYSVLRVRRVPRSIMVTFRPRTAVNDAREQHRMHLRHVVAPRMRTLHLSRSSTAAGGSSTP